MNRVIFFESISGISWPKMLVDFFDHFIALKNIVEDTGKITVINNTDSNITFDIIFNNLDCKNNALNLINSLDGVINIYGRQIQVFAETQSDINLRISLM